MLKKLCKQLKQVESEVEVMDRITPIFCPCCGGQSDVIYYNLGKFVRCENCGLRTPEYDTTEKAVEAWNRRINYE